MLATPGCTPGRGEGMAFSSIVSPSATAAMRAIWWSSAVVFSRIEDRGSGIGDRVWCGAVVFPRSSILAPRSCISVIEAVIFLGAAGQLDADLIGQADGDLPGLLQPALAHAILSRAGIGDDTRLALLNADDADAKRAGNFDLLVARQRHFAENLPAAADDGPVGEDAAPQLEHEQHHAQAAEQQRQPVAGLEVRQDGRADGLMRVHGGAPALVAAARNAGQVFPRDRPNGAARRCSRWQR